MDPQETRQHFEERGFAIFPGVIDQQQVESLRAFFIELFAQEPTYKGDRKDIRHDIYARYPETRFLLGHPPVVEALKTILGPNPVSLPEMAVHDSGFGGWHKDTSSLDLAGKTWHYDPEFRMIQAAIYLQPNGEYGGGLDIVPGSQNDRPDDNGGGALKRLVKRGKDALSRKPYTIPSNAGDMVIFDVRCDHKATSPTACEPDDIPAEHRKFAAFSVWSATREHAEKYREHIASRKGYDYLEGHSYPEDVETIARENDFALV
jgi:hypothetical protein